ncbi:HAD-IIIC family phosphatase [Pusillimonas sp. SM2304]|uniref:HAD-IIIC family phosphatase n=1 Tax=Pusillimonas sp. SM2304 TaxID=3073241 RepID=UPI0028748D75|nr:HAD-IIIC family phosphatase [Pusillimonas sp. SM2304]MDS1141165.1 HAD-IIIC family phosphatase [Pusillimonas sp. SM2304]
MLAYCQAQDVLFAETLSRLNLQALELPPRRTGRLRANVWRNHNFETFEGLLRPFLVYAGLDLECRVSEYDDTLGFAQWAPADVEILWVDSSRYTDRMTLEDWLAWLRGRLQDLRSRSSAPILLASWDPWGARDGAPGLAALTDAVPGAYVADLSAASIDEGIVLLDPRVAKVSGSPISRPAQVALARRLGCHWLPGLLLPPIKAVAVDLDNTLHAGVLGEDGPDGVRLDVGHVALQESLRALKERGVFLALISRNEREDVEALFAHRADYPLRWEDFSVIEVSWGSKADALGRVARQLRIALDAVLFVDDNPGELASVAAGCPGIHALFADSTGAGTYRALKYFPGLCRLSVSADDARRVEDMKANAERDTLLRAAGGEEQYFRELGIALTLRYDQVADISRLADLCRKTNQFNLALRRYNQADLASLMVRDDACVAAVSLSDRLSDSGTIAALVAVREGDMLTVTELCLSCRALGRRLEDMIVISAIRGMRLFDGCAQILFDYASGPRNQPARRWLDGLPDRLGAKVAGDGGEMPAESLRQFSAPSGVELMQE